MSKLPKHTANYFKAFGYDESSVILCECGCGKVANDIHHVVSRSLGGKDTINNLIALARNCHEAAHGPMAASHKLKFKQIIANR
jgi:5-methylcytosine-specific restriction endonuclease McrA